MSSGPFRIGASPEEWPGLSKLIEEAGGVIQVCGKILGTGGAVDHWDGTNLKKRLESEMGDLLAAMSFVQYRGGLDRANIQARADEKLRRFEEWHIAAGGEP